MQGRVPGSPHLSLGMRGQRAEILATRLARRQGGVVSHGQLLDAGLSPAAVHRRVAAGSLLPVHRGVYALGYRDLSREGIWHAAALATGPKSAVSHGDAGASWRFTRMTSGPVAVTAPGTSGRARRRGIHLHRAPLPPEDVIVRDGLRVTSPERTLLDLAATLGERELERALDEAHYLNRVSAATLAGALERNRARPGVAALRALLRGHELGSTRTETALEESFLRATRAAGLPLPRCQQWIGRHRVDFLWAAERVIVEVDGPAHRRRSHQLRDAARDVELDGRGYEVLRVDEDEVDLRPDLALARVGRALSPSGRSG
jgi:very-short-patch-repair endonuclease